MPFEHKPNQGSIFKNTYKDKETDPDMKGDGLIDASQLGIGDGQIEVKIYAWTNKTKGGDKYLKISLRPKEDKAEKQVEAPEEDDDDDLPF